MDRRGARLRLGGGWEERGRRASLLTCVWEAKCHSWDVFFPLMLLALDAIVFRGLVLLCAYVCVGVRGGVFVCCPGFSCTCRV